MKSKKILIAECAPSAVDSIGHLLADAGHDVTQVADGDTAWEEIGAGRYDLVVSDLDLPEMNGMSLLRKIREKDVSLPVVLVSAGAGVQQAVDAIKSGATDFLTKPISPRMMEVLTKLSKNGDSSDVRQRSSVKHTIITQNRKMGVLLRIAGEVADSPATIFIQGESGTGKELLARYIHRCSGRKTSPFVAINCSALPETLLESELFGHEKGAFTGAVAAKKGKFEAAQGGTLLLDEISEMDIQLQAKLLRVLQEKEIDRVGGKRPVAIDVRIIATTNRDIEKEVREGRFREDLYYRLNVIPLVLPPLRERLDDIPLLSKYFIEKYNEIDKRYVKGLTEDALSALMNMPFKGNVRELENLIERAILLCKGDYVTADMFFVPSLGRNREHMPANPLPFLPLREMEKKAIYQALDKTNGNRTHAAEMLGISVRTLRNKLNEYRERMTA